MLDPEKVRRIVYEMGRQVCRTEVTVKCRIGADDRDSYPGRKRLNLDCAIADHGFDLHNLPMA